MKLLVTDYDNTLELHYDYTDNIAILRRNISAINNFMNHNIVCIATGRHFDAIYKTLTQNNIKFNYLCANNGAELYDKNYKLLFCLPLEEYDLKILMNLKEKVFFRNPFKCNLISSANLYIENLNEYDSLKQYLNNNLKNSLIEYKFPKIKIVNNKCNKLNVISIIQKAEKILDKNIYTIGDDVNDIDMIIHYNGASLTTANEEVKKIAPRVYDELNQFINYVGEKQD